MNGRTTERNRNIVSGAIGLVILLSLIFWGGGNTVSLTG